MIATLAALDFLRDPADFLIALAACVAFAVLAFAAWRMYTEPDRRA